MRYEVTPDIRARFSKSLLSRIRFGSLQYRDGIEDYASLYVDCVLSRSLRRAGPYGIGAGSLAALRAIIGATVA